MVVLATRIPEPEYRWREEMQAREEVREFVATDERIIRRWHEILDAGTHEGASFEELAGRIESDITLEYRKSFEQLSALNLDPAAPSAMTLDILRKYAQLRGDASHWLAEGLRLKDQQRIREALENGAPGAVRSTGYRTPGVAGALMISGRRSATPSALPQRCRML